jgi:hypothetical protein
MGQLIPNGQRGASIEENNPHHSPQQSLYGGNCFLRSCPGKSISDGIDAMNEMPRRHKFTTDLGGESRILWKVVRILLLHLDWLCY